jgi:REP element-mobilizing transposase RayT
MSRGVEGREIFNDDSDRTVFLKMLSDAKIAHEFHIFAYCLMNNHFHFLIQIGDSPLYSGMHQLLTRYSQHFNQRHEHHGHLFQSRYTAPLCRQDSYLRTLLRYIHYNPVRAGLVTDPADWRWSGHHGLIGTTKDSLLDVDKLADLRGENVSQLRASYSESMSEISTGTLANDYMDGKPGTNMPNIPTLTVLADWVARDHGVSVEDLCGGKRGKIISPAKLAFIGMAQNHGYKLCDVAATLNCSPAAVTLLRKRKS